MTGALPKSVLILEMVGMVLLALALLLMIPAALAFVWQVAQRLTPQLMKPSSDSSRSDREKENDSNH